MLILQKIQETVVYRGGARTVQPPALSFEVNNGETLLFNKGYREVVSSVGDCFDLRDIQELVVSVAWFYGWEYGGDAPLPHDLEFVECNKYLFYDREGNPFATLYYAESENAFLEFGPYDTRLSISEKEFILVFCDELAKFWGWMPEYRKKGALR